MENSAIRFFIENKDNLAEYIGKIKVNREKTLVKYGYLKDKSLSVTIMTYGPLDETITSYEEKIQCMFNSKEAINDLNEFIEGINLPYTFLFGPFLNVTKDDGVITHACNITAKFKKK